MRGIPDAPWIREAEATGYYEFGWWNNPPADDEDDEEDLEVDNEL